ncbi:hypothetical protein CHRYSEOSP005_29370 [Chryseobacterium sp. Alg-005]|uniref:hypothetical protein n=1 Tax=Chryseobacterium sp. Alg-005 TaxID=3159516 RepID=UPI003555A0F5
MKFKNNFLLFFLLTLLSSCIERKNLNSKEKIILFKQVNESTDLEVDFNIKRFWQVNFEDKTFITQDFMSSSFDRILDSLNVLTYVNNKKPQFNDYVEYAFVKYKSNKNNDTIYFDGRSKWWVIQEGKVKQYKDVKEKMKNRLQYIYPIFRDCSPATLNPNNL